MGQALFGAESICIVFLSFLVVTRLFSIRRSHRSEQPSMVDYLYKISRITGESEYNIFVKSAENWPVSQAMVERDFSRYLAGQTVPHYVQDFVRKNRHHIDELRLPLF